MNTRTERTYTNFKIGQNSRIFTNFKTLSPEFSIYDGCDDGLAYRRRWAKLFYARVCVCVFVLILQRPLPRYRL